MRSSTTGRVLGLIALISSCGVQQPQPGRSRAAITGGEVDNGDPAVVSLQLSGGGSCSGTLISPRMVLTAEHCSMDPPSFGTVSFGTIVNAPTRRVTVADTVVHPSRDLRLVKLSTPVGDIAPLQINRVPLSFSDVGKAVRHVGFGLDGYPKGQSDTKRHASLLVTGVSFDEVIIGSDDGLEGVCFGDSGGPGLMRTGGGTDEVIIGVASYLVDVPICYGAAADVRVDTFAGWVDEISADWEQVSCEPGGGCMPNCVPADPDCFCVYDALCDLRCPNLSLDPDCTPGCGNDGVCSGSACPFRDPDCIAVGSTCLNDSQCEARTCATQKGKRFCSLGCARTDECPVSMYCSATNHVCLFRPLLGAGCDATLPCGEGLCVFEPDGGQQCRSTCETSAGCLPAEQCLATSSTPGVCRPKVVVEAPPVVKKQGCASAPGGLWLALAALLALRRRAAQGSSSRTSSPAVVV